MLKITFSDNSECIKLTLIGISVFVLAVEFYPLSALVENGSSQISWQNVTDTECAVNSFSESLCYAATYFPETGICVAECTDMDTVPENVTLVNSTINSTVLLRTYNRGIITNQKPLQDIQTVYSKSSNLSFESLIYILKNIFQFLSTTQ